MPRYETPMFDLEICRLIGATGSARLLAESGRRVAGRDVLCAGFRHAQRLAAQGVPQGMLLVRLWRAALVEYAGRDAVQPASGTPVSGGIDLPAGGLPAAGLP